MEKTPSRGKQAAAELRGVLARLALSAAPLARRLLPERLRRRWRERLYRAANRREFRRAPAPASLRPGVRLYGLLDEPTGMGSAARLLAGGLRAAGVPLTAVPLRSGAAGGAAGAPREEPAADGGMNANLFVFNADCTGYFLHQLGAGALRGRYNIAHWSWELPVFPDVWRESFEPFQEIWTISSFCRDAIAAASPLPVTRIPYGVTAEPDAALTRGDLGLPEGRVLFLCMYDVRSVQARKNPLGAVEAYCRAFPAPGGDTGLVVKVSGADGAPAELAALRARLAGRSDVYLLDRELTKPRTDGLTALCDVFVSLHRAEGFGLPIAEAMLLGRPVVVTGWSGNMDFTDPSNACCVKYELRPVGRLAAPPYDAWQIWAEPDTDDAAAYLRRLAADAGLRARLGAAGRRTIEEKFSPRVCGEAMAARLRALGLLRQES